MKIIFTIINDLTYDQRMQRIGTSLHEAGYEVLIVGRKKKNTKVIDLPFSYIHLDCWFDRGLLMYAEMNIRLFFFLLFKKWDIVGSIDLDTLLPGYCAKRLKRKQQVYDAHEYYVELPELKTKPLVRKFWTTLANSLIPRMQYAYTVCESLAIIFNEKYKVPFEVFRNVPFQKPKPKVEKANPKVLLYQGWLNEGRGIKEAILSLQYIQHEVQLWLVGEGDKYLELKQLVEEENLEAKVKFFGFCKPEELWAITPQATIGLNLLAANGLNYYYSLANKFFDYIQAGIPSLNPAFPEYKKILSQYEVGVLLQDILPQTIAKAVNALLSNPEEYNKMLVNAQKAKEALTWEKEAEKLIFFYKKHFPL